MKRNRERVRKDEGKRIAAQLQLDQVSHSWKACITATVHNPCPASAFL